MLHPFGNLTVPSAARPEVGAALHYLSRAAGERALIGRLEHGSRAYDLIIAHDGNDFFDPADDAIHWDPRSALRTTEGGRQSPALGLGHEIAHAVERPLTEARLARRYDARYDNAEERRVITGSEQRAARVLGEDRRYDHDGTLYRVASPTAR